MQPLPCPVPGADDITDRDAIPHVLAVLDSSEYPSKALGRGAVDGNEAARDSRQGTSSLLATGVCPCSHIQRETVISQLARLLDSDATLTSSALKQNNLSLLREKHAEHRRDLVRIRNTVSQARDRANLLTNVRSDIDEYNRANQQQNPEAAEADYMLQERSRVDNSHNMVDSVLSQAYAVQDNFNLQRETLASINRRITLAASQVPGINSLINRISAKKRRDGIIMGVFIAFCFLLFWWFM